MRQMSFTFCLSVLVTISLIFVSCSKEGSAGPAGAQGPQGPAGPAGSQGPKGDTGTANVIYSAWLDVTFALNPDSVYEATIPAPKLTNAILSQGEIKVYVNFNTAADPFVIPIPFFNGGVIINSNYSLQTIGLISNVNASTFTDSLGKAFQYRYILIPGEVPGVKRPNINWNNYGEVQQYLKLTN